MESELLALLQNAKPNRDKLDELITVLEAAASIDLSDVEQQQQEARLDDQLEALESEAYFLTED